MKNRTRQFVYLSLAVTALLAGSIAGMAQESQPAASHGEHASGGEHAADPMNDPAMMEAWMKLAAPGEQHALLGKMDGEYTHTTKYRMMPDQEFMTSEGTARYMSTLEGRYIHEDFNGEMMGNPMTGAALFGYDNVKQKYTGLWIDNWSTSILYSEGNYDEELGAIVYHGTYFDPMYQAEKSFKNILTIKDDGDHTFVMHSEGPDGQMFKSLHIEYTKK